MKKLFLLAVLLSNVAFAQLGVGFVWVKADTFRTRDASSSVVFTYKKNTGSEIRLSTTDAIFKDYRATKKGLEYDADYSANATSRTLTDVGHVGSLISSAIASYTPTARTITINGTAQDLSANRSWTLNTSNVSESGGVLYFTDARARAALSLTTTGTSGAATYNSSTGVINIPQYTSSSGTVTSVGMSSSDLSVSGSPVTSSGNFTVNLNNSGVSAGTYNTVTVNAKGIVTGGNASAPTMQSRSLNSAYQISSTQSVRVSYTVTLSAPLSLGGAFAFLEYADNVGFTTNVVTVTSAGDSSIALLASKAFNIQGEIPIGKYVRLRTTSTGGGSVAYTYGQETTY